MSTTEERTLKWLNDNIDFFTRYRAEPINANRTAFYDEMIERQRTAISAIETCRQLKKSLFGKENVTNDELVRMVLQLKSGGWMQETGGRTMKTPDEIKLKPCPFCGGKVSLVLCDDEGNLHDEAYREHPYSGLGFKLHHAHEENPECPIASYECDGGILGRVYIYDTEEQAAEAWNRRAEYE